MSSDKRSFTQWAHDNRDRLWVAADKLATDQLAAMSRGHKDDCACDVCRELRRRR